MYYNFDELTADELEVLANEVYESVVLNNQFPQESGADEELTVGQKADGGTAQYTMIPPPEEDDTEFANYSGS